MYAWLMGSAALILLLAAAPANEAHAAPAKNCDKPKQKSGLLGSLAGNLAGDVLGRAGVPSSVGGVYIPIRSVLSEGITRLLNCKEQRQAANATTEAIRGGVGTEVKWQSESRQNVSGSSKVTGEQELADGRHCMTVTDVVIIDGEETTVPKRMCRGNDGGYQKA